MGRWELLSETARLIRKHALVLVVIITPAFVATYLVNSFFSTYKVFPSVFRQHPTQTFISTSLVRGVQFFLGWLFLSLEFAVVVNYIAGEGGDEGRLNSAVLAVRDRGARIASLSWSLYWRAVAVFIPLMMLIFTASEFLLRARDHVGRWSISIEVFLVFALTALIGSKWLFAVPEVVLSGKDVRSALRATTALEPLHEPLLVLALLFSFVLTFSVITWPPLVLSYVYLPAFWPERLLRFIQNWLTPVTSLVFETWATMMLFVGTTVLWLNRERSLNEETVYADPLHR
jgi:hypothetical protein